MESSKIHLPTPKISKRLKLLLILEILLLLSAYGFITYSYHHMERQKTETSIQQLNYSLLTSIQYAAGTLDTLSKSPLGNEPYSAGPSLWSYLTSPDSRKENPAKFEAFFIDKYYQLNLLFSDLNALFLFDPSGEVLTYKYNNTHYYILNNLPAKPWLDTISQKKGALTFFTQKEVQSLGYEAEGKLLFAGRQLNNIASYKPAVIVIAGLDITDISLSFEKHKLFDSQEFACFDGDGKLLFSSDGFSSPDFADLQNAEQEPKTNVYYHIVSDTEHNLYSVIATNKRDMTQAASSMNYILLLLIPIVLLSNLGLAVYIIRSVIRAYSTMTEKVYLQSITEKDLNLQMLRSQINPHFLYNTLDSMRMASLKAGYMHLASMCELLAKILRYGVSASENLVTVEEEARHLDEYIQLIHLRYANIDIQTYIEPSIRKHRIIKLLLQPLVENSVNHGLDDTAANGSIQIWGYQKENKLVFTVTDNGNGISGEQLALLNDYLNDKNTEFKSIGLKNIKKRIQLYYGKEYDLTIDSRLYQGTSVTVTLPIMQEQPDKSERTLHDK